jgi:two-component system, OmpR family, sensor kinase
MALRTRLVAATILVALTALVIAGVATYAAFGRSQLRQIDDTLQGTHEPIERAVATSPSDLGRAIEDAAPGTFIALERPDGTIEVSIPAREPGHEGVTADLDQLRVPRTEQLGTVDLPVFQTVRTSSPGVDMRMRVSRLGDGRLLVIGESLRGAAESGRRLVIIEFIVAGAALLIAGLLGWILVRIGLRPLRRVERTALSIAHGGGLDREVPGSRRTDEVGQLATALNTMLDRIRNAFTERDTTEQALRYSEERMRRFVADVSHELRTPLAAVSAYTELFDRGARDRPEDLERAMHGIDLETARMRGLVEELLLLARLDEGLPLSLERIDLNEIVVESITAARTVAPAWPVSLRASDVVVVSGDGRRLRQVFDNLLTNVCSHTPAGTATSITIDVEDDRAVVTVRDNGPGMTSERARRIFERFYRVDASRSRSSGGSGLGMAIVDALVTAHNGKIRVDTAPGCGLAITISLPLRRLA